MKINIENDPLKRYLINAKYLKYKLDKIFTIAITGSCGKTTIALYIYYFLKNKNKNVCYIGTHKILYKDLNIQTNNTTLEINKLIDIFNKYKIKPKILVLEVSSHGINQARINCFKFDIVALSNLGSDHLDYHLNINNYHNVKLSFLNSCIFSKLVLINKKYQEKYDFNNKNIYFFEYSNLNRFNAISFNKENMYIAYLILKYLKYKDDDIILNLNNIKLNNGRYQIINDNNRKIIIDYAHHIESFESILNNNEYNKVVVFGCGGNRDKIKRSIMGQIACKYCKYVIITTDNCRNENLDDIIKDITEKISNYLIIKDRYKAIKYAISNYRNLNIFILGKGDENYIFSNNTKIKFNDYNCVINILKDININN